MEVQENENKTKVFRFETSLKLRWESWKNC